MIKKTNMAYIELHTYLKRETAKVFFQMIWVTYCLFLLLDATGLKMATTTTQVCVFCMWQKQ
jgi:hypothetical protein